MPGASDEHVLWLDIPVDEAQSVQVLQAHGYLREVEPGKERGEGGEKEGEMRSEPH